MSNYNVKHDPADRTYRAIVRISKDVQLELAVFHYPERKAYIGTIRRSKVNGMFLTTRINRDNHTIEQIPTARYSAKKLKELFEELERQEFTGEYLQGWINWAKELEEED